MDHGKQEELMINKKPVRRDQNNTCMMKGSFQGPLSERRHPPLFAQLQVPPKKSGSSL